jgi:hypothetical protein
MRYNLTHPPRDKIQLAGDMQFTRPALVLNSQEVEARIRAEVPVLLAARQTKSESYGIKIESVAEEGKYRVVKESTEVSLHDEAAKAIKARDTLVSNEILRKMHRSAQTPDDSHCHLTPTHTRDRQHDYGIER